MPRVALSQEQRMEYKLRDLKKWVKMQMAATGKNQTDVGKAIGLPQSSVSLMLKIPDKKGERERKDPFTYGQVLALCELFEVDGKEKERLLTL